MREAVGGQRRRGERRKEKRRAKMVYREAQNAKIGTGMERRNF